MVTFEHYINICTLALIFYKFLLKVNNYVEALIIGYVCLFKHCNFDKY